MSWAGVLFLKKGQVFVDQVDGIMYRLLTLHAGDERINRLNGQRHKFETFKTAQAREEKRAAKRWGPYLRGCRR